MVRFGNSGPQMRFGPISVGFAIMVVSIYDQLNIKSITENLANEYINTAFGFLEKVGVDNARKKEMEAIASSLIGRDK